MQGFMKYETCVVCFLDRPVLGGPVGLPPSVGTSAVRPSELPDSQENLLRRIQASYNFFLPLFFITILHGYPLQELETSRAQLLAENRALTDRTVSHSRQLEIANVVDLTNEFWRVFVEFCETTGLNTIPLVTDAALTADRRLTFRER